MLKAIPLTIIPLVLYNLVAFTIGGTSPAAEIARELFGLGLPSGGRISVSTGDLLIIVALVCLCIEVIKSTRYGAQSIYDNILSMIVFVIYLIEFLLAASCATSTFLILLVIAFLDIITGFAVSVRTARRDISVERPEML